ncbi:nitroreductase/quinone reductase family protein [Nonomuraea turcica]|uniref:nitroreductase/quinone reductase family protein n=1 Tax=Nonomuraea sp. G32 TaxID=3067274 RepID=UPI00273AB22E|nr:nitroreductase/quinone reductase family protein [Nonomuraea sp. G32]MDP4510072.1 nitroreductase/quinone reductase family protein [Nonomuraea sp. G32]
MMWKALDRLQTRLVNPVVSWLLRSPLHDLLSRRIVLLTVTGRRSGAPIRLPVVYERDGDTLAVVSSPRRLWWRNLEGGAPVRLVLEGTARDGHATVRREPAPVVTICMKAKPLAPPPEASGVWWRWTRAVTLGEIAGFTVPAMAGAWVAAPGWGMLGIGPLLQAAVIILAGGVEGTLLGLAQAYALRTTLPAVATRDWVRATVQGAAIAWAIGALPIVLGERMLSWPPVVLGLLGLTLVAAMGLLQWRLLRRHIREAYWWVAATAGSWLVALGVFALVTTPLWQEGQPAWLVVAIGVLGGAAMAATVAALTGAALVRLLARPAHQGLDSVPAGEWRRPA